MQPGCVYESYCTFCSVVKVKFLAYVLNVTQRFVMHIISYANVVYIAGIFYYELHHQPLITL